jgi:hypothetical protein
VSSRSCTIDELAASAAHRLHVQRTPRFPEPFEPNGSLGSMTMDIERFAGQEEPRSSPARLRSEAPSTHAGEDDVAQLAGTLRAADRAYRAHLAELRQGDVEPVADWATAYAEYLLGVR